MGGRVSKSMARRSPSSVCGVLEINWNDDDVAFGCEFDGGAFDTLMSGVQECVDECGSRPECAKFSWKWNGTSGSCRLQDGEASKEEANIVAGNDAACGLASNSTRFGAKQPYRNLGMINFAVARFSDFLIWRLL